MLRTDGAGTVACGDVRTRGSANARDGGLRLRRQDGRHTLRRPREKSRLTARDAHSQVTPQECKHQRAARTQQHSSTLRILPARCFVGDGAKSALGCCGRALRRIGMRRAFSTLCDAPELPVHKNTQEATTQDSCRTALYPVQAHTRTVSFSHSINHSFRGFTQASTARARTS